MTPIDIRDTAIPEPVAWQPRYKQEVIDHHAGELWEYAMSVYPTKEGAENYGLGGHKVRPLYPASTIEALTAQLDALKEENERTKRNLSEMTADRDSWQSQSDRLTKECVRVIKERDGLKEALTPFADEAHCYDPDEGDNDDSVWMTPVNFKIRDLRRARAALTQPPLPESGESVEGGEEPAPQLDVRVKPLEWAQLYPEQTMFPKDWHGTGVLGSRYVIAQHHPRSDFYVLGTAYPSLENAKSAAQADYERIILSALSTPSPDVEAQSNYDRGVRDGVGQALEMAVSQAVLMADLAIEGLPENARNHEAMEAALTRFSYSIRVRVEALLGTRAQQPDAMADIAAERRRQIEVEGWTPGHDDAHSDGELARAASCYAYHGSWTDSDRQKMENRFPQNWPWERMWWKPTTARRDLIKAAALLLAEIERLDRAATEGSADA